MKLQLNYVPLLPDDLGMTFAVVADLHDTDYSKILAVIDEIEPSAVLVPGDVVHDNEHTAVGLAFLTDCASRYPTFCSIGNHENKCEGIRGKIRATGATLLDNEWVRFGGAVIGGLSSGYVDEKQGRMRKTPPPDIHFANEFAGIRGCKLLLSHHPEYFPLLSSLAIDLIVSGHAHGGQWRIFGLPVFAPGQGLFPKYTSGLCGEKMYVSRGLSNRTPFPRFGNPAELVILTGKSDDRSGKNVDLFR